MALEHFGIAWKALKKNWKPLVAGSVTLSVILYAFLIIGLIFMIAPVATSLVTNADTMSDAEFTTMLTEVIFTEANMTGILLGVLIILFGIAIYSILTTAFIKVCADALKGKGKVKLGTMFDEAKHRWKTFLALNLLIMLIVFTVYAVMILLVITLAALNPIIMIIGILAIVLAFLLIMPLLMFSAYSVVLDKVGAITGIKRSIRMVRANYVETIILLIAVVIFSVLISSITGIASGTTEELNFADFLGMIISIVLMPYIYLIYVSYYISKRKPIRKIRRKKR
ncbi:MAG: hypothetical protein GOV02_04030 [Candidatus Aenigmarchaeota archaeon]|nr:hypothetical protein [Candidatus Aenigmarchaeota archaeon]